jgi:predicted DNA-binding protein (UPF0251 family)
MLTVDELRALRASRSKDARGVKPTTGRAEAICRKFLELRNVHETAEQMFCSEELVWNSLSRYRLVADYVIGALEQP